jgi:hypothetical protein
MRAWNAVAVAVAITVMTSCEALDTLQFQAPSVISSDFASSIKSVQDRRHSGRLLRGDATTNADSDSEDNEQEATEERANTGFSAQMLTEMKAIRQRMDYEDLFTRGATNAQVRSFFKLPAKGEAATHQNWAAYLNYLKYVKEQEAYAAKMAQVAAIKLKLGTYKDWFFAKKSFAEIRSILGLPAKGDAVGHANWEIYQNYLKFYKEFSRQFR